MMMMMMMMMTTMKHLVVVESDQCDVNETVDRHHLDSLTATLRKVDIQ